MTEPPFLTATRTAYDTVADDYAELLRDHLAGQPFDRAMLAVFAELVAGGGDGAAGGRPVADVGCGPGRITAHLHQLGVEAFGVDLSPGMVEVARRSHPGLRFAEGSMTALDMADGGLAGLVAWYSIIHTPPERLPATVAEFHRVLHDGGHLLLAFQAGDEQVHVEQAYGHTISVDAYRLPPERIAGLLEQAGFAVTAQLVRASSEPEKTPQAYLLARKEDPRSR